MLSVHNCSEVSIGIGVRSSKLFTSMLTTSFNFGGLVVVVKIRITEDFPFELKIPGSITILSVNLLNVGTNQSPFLCFNF